jgi:predicted transcriptional regulator
VIKHINTLENTSIIRMKPSDRFHDLLFEMSNENRYGVLLVLQRQARRIADLTREMKLSTTEVRRHVTRLAEVGLIQRDIGGFYHLTPYGEASLLLFQELIFLSSNSEYFKTHTLSKIPTGFVKQIGKLGASIKLNDAMDFLRHIENLIQESKEYVWLLVDQFPLNSISNIVEAIERGVKIKIIEPKDRALNPDIVAMTSKESQALSRARHTPLVEQRMLDEVDALLYLSEGRCVLAVPASDGQYDYKGFTATDPSSLTWCTEFFQHYWDQGDQRTPTVRGVQVERGRVSGMGTSQGQIVVVGRENSDIDAQAVQDAVDNYDEVILKGTFNFGVSTVLISRSVVVTGEGRENDIPSTIIYKKGWRFPFTEFDSVFKVDGEGSNVTIKNIHFTDFNNTCLWARGGNSLTIKNNRITLLSGFGRGGAYGNFGDIVMGIWIEGRDSYEGKVTLEGNYIDFASGGAWGGFHSRGGLEEDPEYRPDLFNHEYYIGVGITVGSVAGNVSINNNIVRNANARGISANSNLASADVQIKHNTVVSDVYGSYPFSSREAGVGILAISAWGNAYPGFNVEIDDNTIKLDKLNHSGIVILGPMTNREGADKLREGAIRNNRVQLQDGYEGIHVRKCDEFEVAGNTISGEAYFGIRISGRKKSGELDLRSLNNLVENNDMTELRIKEPDEYSNAHVDGKMFTGSHDESATAHIWLDNNTQGNVLKIMENETVIDEGTDNKILYQS